MSIHDDPIELELFKNALFAIADEMALTVFRTTYSGVLKDNMDYSTAFCDADGKLVAQGLTLPGHLGSIPTALDVIVAQVPGRHGAGRRVRHERSVRGRHAPARHLRVQAALPRGPPPRVRRHDLPPHRRRRPGRRVERLGLHRDLSGRPAHPAAQAVRRRPPQRHPVRADREERAPAGAAVRRPACPARRLPHRRAAVRSTDRTLRRHDRHRLHGRGDRLRRAADPGGARRAARWHLELRRLDRRRRRRLREADPPVRDHDEAGRSHDRRLDRHRPAGQGRDQQHPLLQQGRELHRDPLGAAFEHPEQRGRVPGDRGDCPAGDDREWGAAGGVRGARPDRLPHGRLRVRLPRHDAARSRVRSLGRRQHRHLDRRLPRRPDAVHLRRLHLRRLGRTPLRRRPGRQLQHVREHGLAFDRGDRNRAAAADRGLRVRPGQGRARQVPRRRAVPARLPLPRGGGRAPGTLRSPALSALRPVRRRRRQAVVELSEPRRREPAAAVQVQHHDPPR